MRLVWLIPSKTLFEYDWIHELIDREVENIDVSDVTNFEIYKNGLYIFNHSIDYESIFKKHEEQGIPFGAIHLSDETLGDSALFYQYNTCKFVIRTYYHPYHSMYKNVLTIGLGYKTDFEKYKQMHNGSNHERYYHWCFAGNLHDSKRLNAIQTFQSVIPYQLHYTKEGFNSKNNLSLDIYVSWLENAKFALCPTGQGNIDSFRLYEACEAGAIPVVLGSTQSQPYNYWTYMFKEWKHPIPFIIGNNWEECSNKVMELLMDKQKYERMRSDLNEFWQIMKIIWKTEISKLLLTLSI